jgi:hypothetical protein
MAASKNQTIESLPLNISWQKCQQYLASQEKNNCWAYLPGDGPSIEATSWAIIALSDREDKILKPVRWLVGAQGDDGGWSTCPSAQGSDWSTASALTALRISAAAYPELGKEIEAPTKAAIQWLTDHVIDLYTPLGKVVYFLLKGESAFNYPRGWPWMPGTFHWIEPTSYSLIALKPFPQTYDEPLLTVIKRANDYLLNYSCYGGGWNYGEIIRLTERLPAYQLDTAEALIALQDMSQLDKVKAGVSFLQKADNKGLSSHTLSWTILAKDIYGCDTTADLQYLLEQQKANGSFSDNILTTAVASCAIASRLKKNILKFDSRKTSETEPSEKLQVQDSNK